MGDELRVSSEANPALASASSSSSLSAACVGSAQDDFCLKWNDHHSIFFSSAEKLCRTDLLTDVTLSCGKSEFSAHKLVLSVCSNYFASLFARSDRSCDSRQAIVYLRDVDPRHMQLLLSYMYRGEINVQESELIELLATARSLQIKGLTEVDESEAHEEQPGNSSIQSPQQSVHTGLIAKKGRGVKPERPKRASSGAVADAHAKRIKEETGSGWGSAASLNQVQVSPSSSARAAEANFVNSGGERFSEEEFELDADGTEPESFELAEGDDGQGLYEDGLETVGCGASGDADADGLAPHPPLASDLAGQLGERYRCTYCGKNFMQKWMRDRHFLVHSRQQPYSCVRCLRRFSLHSSAVRHVRNVHKEKADIASSLVIKS